MSVLNDNIENFIKQKECDSENFCYFLIKIKLDVIITVHFLV